jgi:hypothetical protein
MQPHQHAFAVSPATCAAGARPLTCPWLQPQSDFVEPREGCARRQRSAPCSHCGAGPGESTLLRRQRRTNLPLAPAHFGKESSCGAMKVLTQPSAVAKATGLLSWKRQCCRQLHCDALALEPCVRWRVPPWQQLIRCGSLVLLRCRWVARQLLIVRKQHRIQDDLLQAPEQDARDAGCRILTSSLTLCTFTAALTAQLCKLTCCTRRSSRCT